MEKIKIRALRADEIEVRVGQVGATGVSLLLYKDARCDKRILDEVFGIDGWANCYSEIKGNLYCSIMIQDKNTGMWIQKQDCGVETFADKEKGEASDAFKRAGFNVGIGRELYTKIFIFIPTETKKNEKTGRYELVDRFAKWHVSDIYTNEETEKIEYVQIADKNNKVVFTYGKKPTVKPQPIEEKQEEPKKEEPKQEEPVLNKEQLDELLKLANGRGDLVVRVAEDNGYDNPRKIKAKDFDLIKTAIQAEIMM
jgi:hypothetical protein